MENEININCRSYLAQSVYNYIKEAGGNRIAKTDIAKALGVAYTSVERNFAKLERFGYIKRTGYQNYEVLK